MVKIDAPPEPDVESVRRLILAAIASDDELLESLVLKGGNALRLVYRLVQRTTLDLDFSMKDEFPDAETAGAKLFGAIRRKLESAGLILFDESLVDRPKILPSGGNPRHGGYQARFKVIETDFDEQLHSTEKLRRKYRHRTYEIDVSKYEYCEGKRREAIAPGTKIYVYTPLMIVVEKLRAICQQMPEYPYRANPSPRPADFYDIHMILSQTSIKLEDGLEMLGHVFAAKEVDPRLLGLLSSTKGFHQTRWDKVLLGAPAAGSFDEHFDFVVEKSRALQSFWIK